MNKTAISLALAAVLGAGQLHAETPKTPDPKGVKKTEQCPPTTGSRLRRAPNPDGSCGDNVPGARSYSKDDIDRSGQTDLDKALPQLDPSLRSGGNGQPTTNRP